MEMMDMKRSWEMLFNGYGFEVSEVDGKFDLQLLTEHNRNFLEMLLGELNISFIVIGDILEIHSEEITESSWVQHLERFVDGRTETSFAPNEIPLNKLDVYISGLVMQLNRLGCIMVYSCDGHERRRPHIYFETADFARMGKSILEHVGLTVKRQGKKLTFLLERKILPAAAVELSEITVEQARKIFIQRDELINKAKFEDTLETVLNIPGASGDEGLIRAHVMKELEPLVDNVTVDHYGNILAEKRFGPGPIVLLNAHLDTYEDIVEYREIIKNGEIWSSSEGILGADDRAGVSVVLAAAQSIGNSDFQGTVKYIFTVEEESGLRGAREVAESFLWDVDMAFVIDRRGTGDIVTSCGGYEPFCTSEFGVALERVARGAGYNDWRTVAGGSSDTAIWARNGIESVNLSAGYQFEHTSDEELDVAACYGTYKFLMEILGESRKLWRRIERMGRV